LLDGRRARLWAVRAPERFALMDGVALARAYKSAAQRAFGNGTGNVYPENDEKG